MSSNEWNTSINLPNRKLIFSKYVSFLALFNIIQDLKGSGSSPTGEWVNAINQSLLYFLFPPHFRCMFFPSSSSLTIPPTHTHLSRALSTGDQEEHKSRTRDIRSYRINLHFNSALLPYPHVTSQLETSEFALPVGFSWPAKEQARGIHRAKHLNIPHLWEGGAPLASCIRRSFGPKRLAIAFMSLCSRATPNLERDVVFESVGRRRKEGDFLQGWSKRETSTNSFHRCHVWEFV